MTLKQALLREYTIAGESGATEEQVERFLRQHISRNTPSATIRGARKRLERDGLIRKIAEEPNERGYACGVYAITKAGLELYEKEIAQ